MRFRLLPAILLASSFSAQAGDWPQWRGPMRNGVAAVSVRLLEKLPEGDLPMVWESEPIPSADDGGLGSVVVSGGRAYLSVVWHREVPSESRQINELVVRQLGHQPLGRSAGAGAEDGGNARGGPGVAGKKLEEFTQEWIAANLDKQQQQLFAGYVENRFKKGALALPLEALDKLAGQQQRVFASDAELRAWLDAEKFSEEVKKQVLEAVPPTRRVAADTVICLDVASGRTLWKVDATGEPTGRNSSSTPCVAEGRVFALGSVNAHAVDAETGRPLWSVPLMQKGPGSSPLFVNGVVVVNAKMLYALDAATGLGGGSSRRRAAAIRRR